MTGPIAFWAGAGLAGAGGGVGFLLAWRAFLPPGVQSRFWAEISAAALKAVTVDELDAFVATYRRLFIALGGYLARNLAIAAVGGVAVVAAILLLLGPLARSWDARDGRLAAFAGETEVALDVLGPARAGIDGLSTRLALCRPRKACEAMSWLGFEVGELADAKAGDRMVVVRAYHGDRNPLWPYLSDLEAAFGVGLLLSPLALFVLPKRARQAGGGFQMKAGDFALVQINETLKPLVRAVGDWESRRHRAALDAIAIDRPVFVTGLARSGTTTVLEALSQSPEVGTHQYRDFPFLGAPLTWARLQGALGAEAAPVERPHKDRILITAASPEAFEEPLWRQFFPGRHEPGRNQRLEASTSNSAFEQFFADHIRKILLLRGARRYVSKGNYNVGRIEYLARVFPDAVFLAPVRDPVAHVASLVRQHDRFEGYAAEDPRVGPYLSAAGHFEFGPQRRPLVLSPQGIAGQARLASGDSVAGYAAQWREVYGHILRLREHPELARRVLLIRYEDLCADPSAALDEITRFTGLEHDGIRAYAERISPSPEAISPEVAARKDEIWSLVGDVAARMGYAAS